METGKITRYSHLEYTITADDSRQPMKINLEISILNNGSPTAKLNALGGCVKKVSPVWLNLSCIDTYVVSMPLPNQRIPTICSRPRGSLVSESRPSTSSVSSIGSLCSPALIITNSNVSRPPGLISPMDEFRVPAVGVDFIMFLANDLFSFAVKDKKSGEFSRRVNVNGNLWTPMFISFRDISNIRLGEAALLDLTTAPQRVVHGLMHIIGRRHIEDIQVQPNWRFTLAYNENGEIVIEFETGHGPRTMVVQMALSFHIAAVLKEIKRSTGSSLPMNRVYFKTLIPLTKELVEDIQNAATTANVTFVGIDVFHNAPEM